MSLFGIGTHVTSHDPAYNDVTKLKGGAEATYNFLSWMGVSERADIVRLDDSDSTKAFFISTTATLVSYGLARARRDRAPVFVLLRRQPGVLH